MSRVKSIDSLHFIEYDSAEICLDTYYKSLLELMKCADRIDEIESVCKGSVLEVDLPSQPKELKRSGRGRKNEGLKRKSSTDATRSRKTKKTSTSKGPTIQNTKS